MVKGLVPFRTYMLFFCTFKAQLNLKCMLTYVYSNTCMYVHRCDIPEELKTEIINGIIVPRLIGRHKKVTSAILLYANTRFHQLSVLYRLTFLSFIFSDFLQISQDPGAFYDYLEQCQVMYLCSHVKGNVVDI